MLDSIEHERLPHPGKGEWLQAELSTEKTRLVTWLPAQTKGLREGVTVTLKGADGIWTVVRLYKKLRLKV